MSEILYEKHKLLSFDKSYSTEVYIKNPDKYRQLEIDTLKADNLKLEKKFPCSCINKLSVIIIMDIRQI